ncbi:TonB-dependent receptor [Hymenobacter sp. NBH84]|uniref:TonB-dependent receptor n=1 Tax=Hymenobacter sp. NBH84 TaxID=2596915 RepID=UPI002156083E|nr:TonB-dependent receptor [Hymenobacter sp. NBH84]
MSVQHGWTQGTTVAAMNGTITDQTGSGLPGATIIAVHTPTNTQYVAPTNSDGRFNIQNMRVGGPYTIRVTFVGYQDVTRDGIFLTLGQNLRLDVNLNESTQQLSEVTVSGRRDPVINSGRTGAATTVQTEQIMRLPTINRSIQDFTRLSPQANGNSLGGRNNRYNNISIDGAVNNDLFGLAGSGTPGGQAGTQPISLDAIEELQVVIAPYDVRQGGFTGGGINAVTRSGTNKVQGSVYAFGRNQSLLRRGPTDDLNRADNFKFYQTGFRVGGPIIKDKLFFFLNGELERRQQPSLTRLRQPGDAANASGVAGATAADADRLRTAVLERYNYDIGGYDPYTYKTNNDKVFARLDWNIDQNNQLTLRHNYVDGFQDNLSRSVNSYSLGSNGYRFNTTTNSTVLEFRSKISSRFANNLIVGYQRIRDKRAPYGGAFPQITIQTIPNSNNGNLVFGGETFSNANSLNQDIVELTDNFTFYAGKHVLTLGTHNEFFKFQNLFVRDIYGNYSYRSINDFLNSDPNFTPASTAHAQPYSYSLSYAPAQGVDPAAQFKVSQLGVYLQDEYTILENLKVTGGVRLDLPILPTTPLNNTAFNNEFNPLFDVSTTKVPTKQLLFSPRVGFNWDVFNDLTTQVRGGTGIFTGRPPYVWISNQYGNTGVNVSRISSFAGSGTITTPVINFTGDPNNQPAAADLGLNPGSSEIDVTAKNFKFPQQFRSNLAIDRKLPGGVTATVEAIYSQVINDILYQDINLKQSTTTTAEGNGRPFYNSNQNARKINPTYTNVILLDNTDKGYTYQLSAQLQKAFNSNLSASAAYTYGKSKDINSGSSSQAYSNWRFNQTPGNPNNPPLAYSNYDLRHRIIASLNYRQEYANHFATGLSLFYTGQSGTPYTYLYNNDVNGDGEAGNDLLYIPSDLNTLAFAPNGSTTGDQVRQQFIDYVNRDSYLKTLSNEFTKRNGARTPWSHQVDARLIQDFYFSSGNGTRHTLEVTFDVSNIGNLLNKDWGRQYFVSNQSYSLLGYRISGTSAADRAIAPTGSPIYSFNNIDRAYQVNQVTSRWQGQLGIRYTFD